MGVEQVGAAVARPGDMDLDDPRRRERIDIGSRIEAVIGRADMDVVDVQQQPAAGILGQPPEKLPLRHLRARNCR